MLIIGHRGAAGLAPENTLMSLKAGLTAGVDVLHIDIHITRDDVAVLLSESALKQIHKLQAPVHTFTLKQLRDFSKKTTLVTLDDVFARYFGKILLNVEVKTRGGGKVVVDAIRRCAGSNQPKWDNVLVSSFKASELIAARRASKQVNLALLHDLNPFAYITYQPFLDLTAVGFHRLHINSLALEIAKKAGLFTYAYTVNRPQALRHLDEIGIDGVVSNRPDILIKAAEK